MEALGGHGPQLNLLGQGLQTRRVTPPVIQSRLQSGCDMSRIRAAREVTTDNDKATVAPILQ